MLPGVQSAKTPRLHIKETAENLSKVVGILVTGRDGDFVDIHRGKKEQIFGVFHPGAMDAFRGMATIGLSIDPPEIVGVAMEFPRYQRGGKRFTKVASDKCLSLDGKVLGLTRRGKIRTGLEGDFQQHQFNQGRRVVLFQSLSLLIIQKAKK